MSAIRLIPNYPVRFNYTDTECYDYDNRSFCQLANQSDKLTFFWGASYCGDNLAVGGDMTDEVVFFSNWSNFNGFSFLPSSDVNYPGLQAIPNTAKQISCNTNLQAGITKVTIVVKSAYANGVINGELHLVIGTGDTSIEPITQEGTYTYYFNTVSNNKLDVQGNFAFDGIIESIEMFKMNTSYRVGIRRTDTLFDSFVDTYFVYDTETDYQYSIPTTYGYTSKDISLFWFNKTWNEVLSDYIKQSSGTTSYEQFTDTTGCFEVCLFDGCTQDLAEKTSATIESGSWTETSGTNWTFNTDKWCHAEGNAGIIQTNTTTDENGIYRVEITVTNYTSGYIDVIFTGYTIGRIEGNGTYVFTAAASSVTTIQLSASSSLNACVTNCSVKFASEDLVADGCSECFNVAEDHECTHLVTYYNKDNAFGVAWSVAQNDIYAPSTDETKFYCSLRLESEMYKSKYNQIQDNFLNSAGKNEITYFDNRKVKEFHIGEIPEYMHDAMAIAKGHDVFMIDGVEYNCEQGYEPEWSDKPRLKYAQSRFLINEKTQKLRNKKC